MQTDHDDAATSVLDIEWPANDGQIITCTLGRQQFEFHVSKLILKFNTATAAAIFGSFRAKFIRICRTL